MFSMAIGHRSSLGFGVLRKSSWSAVKLVCCQLLLKMSSSSCIELFYDIVWQRFSTFQDSRTTWHILIRFADYHWNFPPKFWFSSVKFLDDLFYLFPFFSRLFLVFHALIWFLYNDLNVAMKNIKKINFFCKISWALFKGLACRQQGEVCGPQIENRWCMALTVNLLL